jgi:hypothetical protein
MAAKLSYLFMCLAFKRIYSGQGMAADGVQRKGLGILTRAIIKVGVGIYNYFCRAERASVGVPLGRS